MSLDFFLWSHLKTVVFKTKPENTEELKERITFECGKINEETDNRSLFPDCFREAHF